MSDLVFSPEGSGGAAQLWKVERDGACVGFVSLGIVSDKLRVYDPDRESCLAEFPAVDGVVQFDVVEAWFAARQESKP